MIKILTKFWPILIPIIAYSVWFLFFRKKKEGKNKISDTEARLWTYTLVASLIIAILTIVILFFSEEGRKGEYSPPEYKDGKIIPGRVE